MCVCVYGHVQLRNCKSLKQKYEHACHVRIILYQPLTFWEAQIYSYPIHTAQDLDQVTLEAWCVTRAAGMAANLISTAGLSRHELLAAGWQQEPGCPDAWIPNGEALPNKPPKWADIEAINARDVVRLAAIAEEEPDFPSGAPPEQDEASEMSELVEMFCRPTMRHADSARAPSSKRLLHRQNTLAASSDFDLAARPRSREVSNRSSRADGGGGAASSADIGPGWDSRPHRNRPKVLYGLNSIKPEPWTRSEDLNFGRDAHIEWSTAHRNLVQTAGEGLAQNLDKIEADALKRSELMGNRLLQQQKRREQGQRHEKFVAKQEQRRAHAAARAAGMEAMRQEIEARLLREAQEEEALNEEQEKQRREVQEAEEAAAAAAVAEEVKRADEEQRKLAETLKRKLEAKAAARAEAAARKAGGAGAERDVSPRPRPAVPRSKGDDVKGKSKGTSSGKKKVAKSRR